MFLDTDLEWLMAHIDRGPLETCLLARVRFLSKVTDNRSIRGSIKSKSLQLLPLISAGIAILSAILGHKPGKIQLYMYYRGLHLVYLVNN